MYRGQAEREFKVEVEAIGHVRHKNLVRLLGYCVEGVQRYLILTLLPKNIFWKLFFQFLFIIRFLFDYCPS